MTDPKFYTTLELVEAAGITYRQADWWTTNGILKPLPGVTGMGTRRHYPETEVVIARILGRVRDAIEDRKLGSRQRFVDLAEELRTASGHGRHFWAPGIELDLDVLAKPDNNGA